MPDPIYLHTIVIATDYEETGDLRDVARDAYNGDAILRNDLPWRPLAEQTSCVAARRVGIFKMSTRPFFWRTQ